MVNVLVVLMAKSVVVPMEMMMMMIVRPDGDDALLKWQPWLSPLCPPIQQARSVLAIHCSYSPYTIP